jgi:hypothetical protein
MSTLAKLLIVPALVVAFSVGVALAASGVGGSGTPEAQVAPGTSTDDTTTLDTTTTVGTTTTEDDDRGGRRDDDAREPGEDVRGPCDEAEHASDPRCTGVGDDRDDNSGPGNAHEDRDDHADDDNSGPGNGDDDDDDRSGHEGGDDDSSGPGDGDDDR